jgi:hypothetical protein
MTAYFKKKSQLVKKTRPDVANEKSTCVYAFVSIKVLRGLRCSCSAKWWSLHYGFTLMGLTSSAWANTIAGVGRDSNGRFFSNGVESGNLFSTFNLCRWLTSKKETLRESFVMKGCEMNQHSWKNAKSKIDDGRLDVRMRSDTHETITTNP